MITSIGKALENLPEDHFPNESQLHHPIIRVEEAISRLSNNPNVPPHLLDALKMAEGFIAIFKKQSR